MLLLNNHTSSAIASFLKVSRSFRVQCQERSESSSEDMLSVGKREKKNILITQMSKERLRSFI